MSMVDKTGQENLQIGEDFSNQTVIADYILKNSLIACKLVLIAICVLFATACASQLSETLPTETPPPVGQAPVEKSYSPRPTETPIPASARTIKSTPTSIDCTYDLTFVAAVQLESGVLISFDAPEKIPYIDMNSIYEVDMGDNVAVYVNSKEATGYKTGLYNPDRPDRLFILFSEFRPFDEIQIKFLESEKLHCSTPKVLKDIDPYHTPEVPRSEDPMCVPDEEETLIPIDPPPVPMPPDSPSEVFYQE